MPALKAFLHAYGFDAPMTVAGFRLVPASVRGEHVQVERFRRYQYPLQMEFLDASGHGDVAALLAALTVAWERPRTVDSHYGNPYRCVIDVPRVVSTVKRLDGGRLVQLAAMGHGVRVFGKG